VPFHLGFRGFALVGGTPRILITRRSRVQIRPRYPRPLVNGLLARAFHRTGVPFCRASTVSSTVLTWAFVNL
jgi:hypothetical protein